MYPIGENQGHNVDIGVGIARTRGQDSDAGGNEAALPNDPVRQYLI
jgi:hypothetical protein